MTVNMEKLIMSMNQDVVEGQGNSHSVAVSKSHTFGVETGLTSSRKDGFFAGMVGALKFNYSFGSTRTVTDSQSWSSQIGMNTGRSCLFKCQCKVF
ncbi:hypothetical protein CN899_29045 [Bacillus thuringiensis]|uniref:Uncharacterized protein n=1 Tax=Bacillus thuringiensis TaxID=1428 RepID=A0A9X7BUF2_BACTU|nr:hypothetical protein CN899_29045 [Bacillus thuringiensis]